VIRKISIILEGREATTAIESIDIDIDLQFAGDVSGVFFQGQEPCATGDSELEHRNALIPQSLSKSGGMIHTVRVMRALHGTEANSLGVATNL